MLRNYNGSYELFEYVGCKNRSSFMSSVCADILGSLPPHANLIYTVHVD